jgi:ADP-heptose:LPS heptosyltransferase
MEADVKNILVIRLKAIGDVLFTLPAVQVLRENFPGAKITFLTSKENAALLEGFRDVDTVWTLDRARLKRGNPFAALAEIVSLLRRMRGGSFSLVVDLQGYVETAALAWWSGAPRRWGSVYNTGRRWAYTTGVTRDYALHPIEWNLFLLRECGVQSEKFRNEFSPPASALEAARNFFSANKLSPEARTLFIQPFTSSALKDWPLEHFLQVADFWRGRGWQVIFGGGPKDRATLEPARQAGFAVSAGETLLVTAGLMKLSTLILGGDTGIPHLAVAMGQRVLILMHSNQAGACVPFQHPDWTVTPSAGQPMSAIPVEAVNAACEKAFADLERSDEAME